MALPSKITIDKAALDPEAIDLGQLLGLLVDPTGEHVDLFLGWFGDAVGQLEGAQHRVAALVAVLGDFLGPPLGDSPSIRARGKDVPAQWFDIPRPPVPGAIARDAGQWGETIFYVVAPEENATEGVIGLAVSYPLSLGDLTLRAFLFFPLFELSDGSPAKFVLTSADYPSQVGLSISSSAEFTEGSVSFSSLELLGLLPFSGAAPSFELDFVGLKGTSEPGRYTSLATLVASQDALSWIATVILQGGYFLNTYIGRSKATVADVLLAAKLLKINATTKKYELSLDQLHGTPVRIAENIVFAVLDSLADSEKPILPLRGGGVFVVAETDPAGGTDYGLRLQIEDIAVLGGKNKGKKGGGQEPKRKPRELDVQVGKFLAGEESKSSWVARSLGLKKDFPEPGVAVYLLHKNGQTLSFEPRLELISLGFDFKGGGERPLFDLKGYTLGGVEARLYLAEDKGAWVYGFGGSFDGLGVPLGPGFGKSTKETQNKVAQSLLSSGSEEKKGKGDQAPINPSLGISGAWIHGGKFTVQLYDKKGKPTDKVWIPIQRAFGPLQCKKIGVGYVDAKKQATLLFDGSVKVGPLAVDLVDLSIGIPVDAPGDFAKYDLGLSGLGLSLKAGSVELSGAFVKLGPDKSATPPRDFTEYDGAVAVKVGTFALAAIGSYAYVGNDESGFTSLFIFAVLDAELGDPTATGALFITGLAGGFGYNRALRLPDAAGVADFPFVAGINDPGALGQTQGQPPDPAKALASLRQLVPPERGEYWFTAGLRFTSFDLINSTALLSIAFGNEIEIALLGLSWISLPPPAPGGSAPVEKYAFAELGIAVKLLPEEGLFSAAAILTPSSFVIDPACKLTGGFAFYVWFGSNPHAGQWVLTLGGYHPDFDPPSYYPKVPRLGFSWHVSSEVSIEGGAYFALTPSAVMAGGSLKILFHSGNLHAWFTAHMDALIVWAPFHYEVSIGISIGVSYRLHLLFITKTLKVELGADVALRGPKMGGTAHVHWFIISFTVDFGAKDRGAPAPLAWTDSNGTGFAQTLLPHVTHEPKKKQRSLLGAMASRLGRGATPLASPEVKSAGLFTIAQNGGVSGTLQQGDDVLWIARADTFEWSVSTAIPATEIELFGVKALQGGYASVGVRPMATSLTSSVLEVSVVDEDQKKNGQSGEVSFRGFTYTTLATAVPAAKWGEPMKKDVDPEPNESLPGRLMGIAGVRAAPPGLHPTGTDTLDVDMKLGFGYDEVERVPDLLTPHELPIGPGTSPPAPVPAADPGSIATIQDTIATKAEAARGEVFATLLAIGIDPVTNQNPVAFGSLPGSYLDGAPMILATHA